MKSMIKQKAAFFGEWVRLYWLRFMLFITRFKGHDVRTLDSIAAIPESLGWGQHWKKDPGRADKWYHPRLIQRRIDEKRSGYGDCDEHAIWWSTQLLKAKLASEVTIGLVRYIDHEDKEQGHYVCVYRDNGGTPYWGDYNLPQKVDPDVPWRWAVQVIESGYGKRLVLAATYTVTLGKHDTPHIRLRALELF